MKYIPTEDQFICVLNKKIEVGRALNALGNELIEKDIIFSDFTDMMVEGTYFDQHERMKSTPEADLEYYGICFFMNAKESRELTKKFSLYS